MAQPFWKTKFCIFLKVKHLYDPAFHSEIFTHRILKHMSTEDIYANVHRSFVYNSQKLKTLNEWLNKLWCIHIIG